jgi:hypothetical protein
MIQEQGRYNSLDEYMYRHFPKHAYKLPLKLKETIYIFSRVRQQACNFRAEKKKVSY